jgi:biotin transport system substrate-specific component
MKLISKTEHKIVLQKEHILSILQVLAASLFIGLCAQIKIPLFFTPVPLTGQTFAVMLIGALLGSRKGILAVLCYLIEGACGFPVWAPGASVGFLRLIGPTGGYLVGYLLQAYLVGFFVERMRPIEAKKTWLTLVMTSALQLGIGAFWLASFVGFQNILWMGVYPFIPGEMVKAAFVTWYLKCRKAV